MTVLLDPGTDPNSYKDGAIRIWKATAGLWKGDAVDSANSTADPNWTGATQEYSTTATDWKNIANGKTTTGISVGTTAQPTITSASGWVNVASLTSPRTGNAMIAGACFCQRHNNISGDFACFGRIVNVTAGTTLFDGSVSGYRTNIGDVDTPDPTTVIWQGNVNSGDVIHFDIEATIVPAGNSADFNHGGTFFLTVGSV